MDKVNGIMNELNDMANFKGFGKAVKDKEFIENPVEAYEKLKAENAKLKEKFEIESLTDETTKEIIYRSNVVNKLKELLKLRIEDLCESCGASSMMPMPCTVYKQTLQEIKKICKNSHTSASEDYYRTADKILQEINEVIGAEE